MSGSLSIDFPIAVFGDASTGVWGLAVGGAEPQLAQALRNGSGLGRQPLQWLVPEARRGSSTLARRFSSVP